MFSPRSPEIILPGKGVILKNIHPGIEERLVRFGVYLL